MGSQEQTGIATGSGGASGASAPGGKGRTNREAEPEEEGEEGREARKIPSPIGPSREERERHNLTHTPYRAWCPHCVRARDRNNPHYQGKPGEQEGAVPRISFDYFFLTKEDEAGNKNL